MLRGFTRVNMWKNVLKHYYSLARKMDYPKTSKKKQIQISSSYISAIKQRKTLQPIGNIGIGI